ncbi:ROK family protein [Candidatus Clostridium radicumherbarum]|uniref:ROK family protein n=1 Tax=Candidatus Clostridium radicumherbarum TaxID=3381662 RepID=A0ABW8TSZ3_9CLOT
MDHSEIKTANKKSILKLLAQERELTKLEISRKLDISVPTVTTIVGELLEEGLVEEAGMATSTGGRKPVIIRFLPESRYSIGIDLEKNHIRAIITDLDGRILEDNKLFQRSIKKVKVLEDIKNLIMDLLDSRENIKNKVLGIGISLPGTVNEDKLELELAPNFKLKNLCFKELADYFNLPVFLENEANAGALAESNLGIAKNLNNLIYVSITEGIGGGLIINERIYKGKSRRAGEIGHMTINKGGRQCSCGKKGCFETYASNRALINDFNEVSEIKALSIREIIEKYKEHDNDAIKVMNRYLEDLAEGIGNLIFIFNPDYIVIGGEISKYSSIFQDKLIELIFKNNEFYKIGDVEILFSSLGEDSNILGAALIPIFQSFGF